MKSLKSHKSLKSLKSLKHVIEVTQVTEVIEVTGVIEVTQVIEVIEVTHVIEVTEVTEVTEVIEVIEVMSPKSRYRVSSNNLFFKLYYASLPLPLLVYSHFARNSSKSLQPAVSDILPVFFPLPLVGLQPLCT